MKVKINNKMYEIKIAPRELTAVFFTKDEPIKKDDYAFMLLHCPCPRNEKDLKNIKDTAVAKAKENIEELERYLECNKTLHKGDKKK